MYEVKASERASGLHTGERLIELFVVTGAARRRRSRSCTISLAPRGPLT